MGALCLCPQSAYVPLFQLLWKGDLQVTLHCCVSPRLPSKIHLNSQLNLKSPVSLCKKNTETSHLYSRFHFFTAKEYEHSYYSFGVGIESWPHLPRHPADLLESYRFNIKPSVLMYTGLSKPWNLRSHWLLKRYPVIFMFVGCVSSLGSRGQLWSNAAVVLAQPICQSWFWSKFTVLYRTD